MKKIVFAALTALILSLPGVALADGIVLAYDELKSTLSGYHGIPKEDYWQRLDPASTRANLEKLVGDTSAFTILRSRAMLALKYFPGEDVTKLLSAEAKNNRTPYLRAAAHEALADTAGQSAVRVIGEGLTDEDVMVRISATRSLKKIGGPEAKRLLEEGASRETNQTARSVMSKTLEKMK